MWLKVAYGAIAVFLPLVVVCACWLRCEARQVADVPASSAAATACTVACTLNPSELAARRARFARFRSAARDVTQLENGYALRFDFSVDTLREVAGLVAGESQCCSFLEFRLTAAPARNVLDFEITGPEGTKEFLTANAALGAKEQVGE
jgi:hypothetical protein